MYEFKANYDSVVNSQLSGNPGYQTGRPLQATGDTYVKDGFTYLRPSQDGSCPSDDSLRGKVNFGVNVASECQFDVNRYLKNLVEISFNCD